MATSDMNTEATRYDAHDGQRSGALCSCRRKVVPNALSVLCVASTAIDPSKRTAFRACVTWLTSCQLSRAIDLR
jgi:hypothetical protein